VATVTYGPAVTNTVTSLIAGARARTPMVLIAGDTRDPLNLQNVEQAPIAAAAEAPFVEVRSVETWQDDVRGAFQLAVAQSRPIFLNIPVDLMWADVEDFEARQWHARADQKYPHEDALDAALGAVASARRPVILAGRGAMDPGARAALVELGDVLGAPLFTTLEANGLFDDEPYAGGIFGGLATDDGLAAIVESDCVLSFGAGLNRFTTERDSLLDGKSVIVCNDDPERARRDIPTSFVVEGDAEMVAQSMVKLLREAEIGTTGYRDSVGYAATPEKQAAETWGLQSAFTVIDEMLPRDQIMVYDAGRFLVTAYRAFSTVGRRRVVSSMQFGSIGMGMGYAIGAAVAAPDRPVALVVGDGGYMLGGFTELTTAIRYGLDVTVFVVNDGCYGAEYIQFEAKNMDASLSVLEWPDFAAVAKAAGGAGFRATSLHELREAVRAEAGPGPRLIDMRFDPATIGDPRAW
jgi:thiamine pyrophosphate-dependent acetolactate synthase large subunit-like protein